MDVDPKILDLVKAHDESTGMCSLWGHSRRVSKTYPEIMKLGRAALPAILEYLKDNPGMNIQGLLMDIVGEPPLKPVREGGFVKYDVGAGAEAWLDWGREQKLI